MFISQFIKIFKDIVNEIRPRYDSFLKKINPELEKQEQNKDKLIGDIQNILRILESRGEKNKKMIKIK